jgi:hypothetical protein
MALGVIGVGFGDLFLDVGRQFEGHGGFSWGLGCRRCLRASDFPFGVRDARVCA